MRGILVERARKRAAGNTVYLKDVADPTTPNQSVDILALDEALQRLEKLEPRQCRVVELVYFSGLSVEETATVLGVSPRTVRRDWTAARAWLYRELGGSAPDRIDRDVPLETRSPSQSGDLEPVKHEAEWRITLSVKREDLSSAAIEDIVRKLRALTGDDALVLETVELGSVILKLKGSVDGFRVLENLFRNGNLSSVLGLPVEAVAFSEGEAVDSVGPQVAPKDQKPPCHVFCAYSHSDSAFREKLERYLRVLERNGLIRTWHDRKLAGGDDWKGQIDTNLERANLILLLVSSDFLASEYCYDVEMKRALERHNKKQARVVPIILRPALWQQTSLADLQVLPQDAKPVSQWTNRDLAFSRIADDLRNIILQMRID